VLICKKFFETLEIKIILIRRFFFYEKDISTKYNKNEKKTWLQSKNENQVW